MEIPVLDSLENTVNPSEDPLPRDFQGLVEGSALVDNGIWNCCNYPQQCVQFSKINKTTR